MNPSFWKDRPVLVTGATGLLGSWLTKSLVEAGAEVTVLVRDQVPRSKVFLDGTFPRVNAVHGRLEDFETLLRCLNEYAIETVFHLGAQTLVTTANRNPLSTFSANIQGTWNLLEACRIYGGVRRIVVASSDKAYGAQTVLPYEESTPLQGRHPYDVSKSCADLISQAYHHTWGLPVCVTRCGNLYGGGDLNFDRLVPGTIRSVLRGERPVIRSDGSFVRDYFYVEDAVEAYLLLAERMTELRLEGQAFNFSDERPLSALEMVRTVLRLMGSDLEPEIRKEARNEIPAQYLSARKAREVLGWKTTFGLEEGLRRTIAWYHRLLAPDTEAAP